MKHHCGQEAYSRIGAGGCFVCEGKAGELNKEAGEVSDDR